MNKEKLLSCPECSSKRLKIYLINRLKKRHYYMIQCRDCGWSQKFNHYESYLEGDIGNFFEWCKEMKRGGKLRK